MFWMKLPLVICAVLLVMAGPVEAEAEPTWPNVLSLAVDGMGIDLKRQHEDAGDTGSDDGTVLATGFEDVPAGPITELEGAGGVWRAPAGHAAIHAAHRKTGRQSLRILGGAEHGVEFTLGVEDAPAGVVSFWAERWTSRGPFAFRVQGQVNGRWRELYNGDNEIAVGGFNTHVRFALPAGITRLRFMATTPDSSGVMIDDLRIGEAIPMRIKSIDTLQPVSPALVGNRTNPVALIAVETVGLLEPISLEQLCINTAGTTDLHDIEAVEVYYTGTNRTLSNDIPDANFPEEARFGRTQRPAGELRFRGEQELQEGVNYFWVSYKLKDSADIDGRIDAGCEWVRLDNSRDNVVPETVNPDGRQRLGVVMRTAHDDGIRAYRIPGMATTNNGTLIAVYDNRNHGWGDLPGDIDVGMSRSTDGGRTWEPMKIIMDMGNDDGPGLRGNGIGDPAVLVDTETNTIWVIATWSHGNRSWNGSGPGMTPDETGQLMLVKSEDDGVTWSDPINITAQVKDPAWCFLLQGPGKGITLSDGTIMFPAQYQDTPENNRLPRSSVIYSRDHGETWHIGTGAWDDTTEAQVVELEDGVLMINCRYNRQNRRVVRTSTDMGATWEEHPTTREALTEPGSCMASLINVDRELGREYNGVLLFSNPASTAARQEMTIKASTDGGLTWPEDMQVLLDHGRGAGYSCMTMIDEDYVGIVYEGNRAHMTFQRIPLAELIEGDNTQGSAPAPEPNEVEVFASGTEGYASFRIPAITVAANGDVLAFAEGREVPHDHARNDIVLRRSSDNGATWTPLQVVVEMGGDSLNDPNVTVLDDGRVMLVFQRFPEGVHARNSNRTRIADAGYGSATNTQTFIMFSDDHGATWSGPAEFTEQLRRPETISIGSPGVGVQLTRGEHAGRIVVPFYQTRHLGGGNRAWDIFTAYSDDGGESWTRGVLAPHKLRGHPNECQIVESDAGGLRFLSRHQGGRHYATGTSDDGGATWGELAEIDAIASPACMGSIFRYAFADGESPGVVLASMPRGSGRSHGTVMLSEDDGATWPVVRELVEGGFGYSCLTRLPDGRVGCFYETAGYAEIKLAIFDIDWLRAWQE